MTDGDGERVLRGVLVLVGYVLIAWGVWDAFGLDIAMIVFGALLTLIAWADAKSST